MIINSISKVDIQIRLKSYENILLSGGNTCFNALNEQLHSELKNKLIKNMKININKNILVGLVEILFLLWKYLKKCGLLKMIGVKMVVRLFM